jgi:hypothetical protein
LAKTELRRLDGPTISYYRMSPVMLAVGFIILAWAALVIVLGAARVWVERVAATHLRPRR